MANSIKISTCEMHCGGEPLRIIENGFPHVPGDTILEKRRYLVSNLDHYRKFLMWEPRGHRDMYGSLVLNPTDAIAADYSVLFMQNEGYSTMCGHATISLGRYIVEKLWKIKKDEGETKVTIECPCGYVQLWVKHSLDLKENGTVRFHSVPAFAYKTDLDVNVSGVGQLRLDIAYGGAYYAIVSNDQCGIKFGVTPVWDMIKTAMIIKHHLMDTISIEHPSEPDLAFLYGVILVDDKNLFNGQLRETTNLTIFADGEVDRCPTGSGVTARMALLYAKNQVKENETIKFISAANQSEFTGKIANKAQPGSQEGAVVVEVSGKAHFIGSCEFTKEDDDPFGDGFMVK